MSSSYYGSDDEGRLSDAGSFAIVSFIITAIVTVLAAIAAVIGAFVAVGVIWGTSVSVVNYFKAVSTAPNSVGQAVASAWNANVEKMHDFFDKARDYNHILPKLVKIFLVMAGVGVVFVGTVLIPVWIIIHGLALLVMLPFKARENSGTAGTQMDYLPVDDKEEVKRIGNTVHQNLKNNRNVKSGTENQDMRRAAGIRR